MSKSIRTNCTTALQIRVSELNIDDVNEANVKYVKAGVAELRVGALLHKMNCSTIRLEK